MTPPTQRDLRKELVRLRLEMHRQHLRHHAQPLTHPLQHLRQLRIGNPAALEKPMLLTAGVFLSLFASRLGTLGKLARGAIVLYPLLRAGGKVLGREEQQER